LAASLGECPSVDALADWAGEGAARCDARSKLHVIGCDGCRAVYLALLEPETASSEAAGGKAAAQASSPDESSRAQFPPTRVSLLQRLEASEGTVLREALDDFLSIYSAPSYAYLRRLHAQEDPAAVMEMTQEILEGIAEDRRELLAEYAAEQGRFHRFFMSVLRRRATDYRRGQPARRKEPDSPVLALQPGVARVQDSWHFYRDLPEEGIFAAVIRDRCIELAFRRLPSDDQGLLRAGYQGDGGRRKKEVPVNAEVAAARGRLRILWREAIAEVGGSPGELAGYSPGRRG